MNKGEIKGLANLVYFEHSHGSDKGSWSIPVSASLPAGESVSGVELANRTSDGRVNLKQDLLLYGANQDWIGELYMELDTHSLTEDHGLIWVLLNYRDRYRSSACFKADNRFTFTLYRPKWEIENVVYSSTMQEPNGLRIAAGDLEASFNFTSMFSSLRKVKPAADFRFISDGNELRGKNGSVSLL